MSCGIVELSCIVRCIIPWWGAGENVIDRVGSRVARSVRTALVRRRLAAAGSLCAVPVGVAPCRDTHAYPVEQKSFETTGLGQRSTTGQPAARSRPDSGTRDSARPDMRERNMLVAARPEHGMYALIIEALIESHSLALISPVAVRDQAHATRRVVRVKAERHWNCTRLHQWGRSDWAVGAQQQWRHASRV